MPDVAIVRMCAECDYSKLVSLRKQRAHDSQSNINCFIFAASSAVAGTVSFSPGSHSLACRTTAGRDSCWYRGTPSRTHRRRTGGGSLNRWKSSSPPRTGRLARACDPDALLHRPTPSRSRQAFRSTSDGSGRRKVRAAGHPYRRRQVSILPCTLADSIQRLAKIARY